LNKSLAIPRAAGAVLRPIAVRAGRLGLKAYVVGGPVRDWLLGRSTYDLDVVVEGNPAPLANFCAEELGGRAESFGQFGTWRVLSGKLRVDFATSRRERYPEPACLPVVSTPAPIAEDLVRRDFTINAMALPLIEKGAAEIVDPYGGLADLRRRVLRVLHDGSFRDDPTRVFRAARYACRLGFHPAPALTSQARAALDAGHAARLSPHRLAQELLRILGEQDPGCALRRLDAWGYLALIRAALPAPPANLRTPAERLAAIALALGEDGEAFLSRLPVDHHLSAPAREALKLAREKAAPRSAPSPAAARALRAASPKLAVSALKPLWLHGGDLEELGVKPGPKMGEILNAAARAQWEGLLPSRAKALAWLKKRV